MADLVLFDPTTVRDASTYDDPTAAAIGVEIVLIGGEIAVEDGRPLRPSLGRVLGPRSVDPAGRIDRDDLADPLAAQAVEPATEVRH